MELRKLGSSEIEITPIGLGCWQFSEGKGLAGAFWPALDRQTVRAIVRATLDGGVNWFDTAEAYGKGASERALSDALQATDASPHQTVVATKWMPFFRTASSIGRTIGERIDNLSPFPVDLHQVHNPFGILARQRTVMNAMADLVEAGDIRSVGVSNYGAKKMRRCHAYLAERGIPLVSNQVRYSLLDRRIEKNGVMAAARELGITIIAYSPLAQGILTAKYHDDPELIQKKGGPRRWFRSFRSKGLERSREVVDLLRQIAGAHGASPAQVALQWLVRYHGNTVVAIPGASKVSHAESNAACLDFELTGEDLTALDRASRAFI